MKTFALFLLISACALPVEAGRCERLQHRMARAECATSTTIPPPTPTVACETARPYILSAYDPTTGIATIQGSFPMTGGCSGYEFRGASDPEKGIPPAYVPVGGGCTGNLGVTFDEQHRVNQIQGTLQCPCCGALPVLMYPLLIKQP